jgi:hypothetical protein
MQVVAGVFFCAVVLAGTAINIWRVCRQEREEEGDLENAPFLPGKEGRAGALGGRKQTRRRNQA